MQPFRHHRGLVVPIDRADVDTDQIIPKQFLKRIERTGFEDFLFYDWRFDLSGAPIAEFALNQPRYAGGSILLARRNFGCGSSREHAVWALENYGFRVVIAPSFADIFYNNCFKNGVLPIVASDADIEPLFQAVAQHANYSLEVDLEQCSAHDDHGWRMSFTVDPSRRQALLQGLDDIAQTLVHQDKIAAYESRMFGGSTP